jgi:polyisoprenoid-binding protein YceI
MHARMIVPIALSTLALAAGFATPQSKPAQGKPSGQATPGEKGGGEKPAANKRTGPFRAAGGYGIDSPHSTVLFRIKHLNTSYSFGRFDNVSGTFALYPDDLEHSMINVAIDVGSIDTNDKKRDAFLKTEAFFDAEQFPDANFISRAIRKSGDTKYTAEGTLSIHGEKKPVTLELEETGTIDSDKTGVRAGFYGLFTIRRSEFGMTNMMDTLGDEVQITVSIEAVQTDATAKTGAGPKSEPEPKTEPAPKTPPKKG